jgi:membrane protein YdbS with pleckstrin-like domain
LHWWKKVLSAGLRNKLSKLWIYGLIATSISWLTVMELGILGYFPGQSDPDTILSIVFTFLFLSVILASFTFVCAIAGDIERQRS